MCMTCVWHVPKPTEIHVLMPSWLVPLFYLCVWLRLKQLPKALNERVFEVPWRHEFAGWVHWKEDLTCFQHFLTYFVDGSHLVISKLTHFCNLVTVVHSVVWIHVLTMFGSFVTLVSTCEWLHIPHPKNVYWGGEAGHFSYISTPLLLK